MHGLFNIWDLFWRNNALDFEIYIPISCIMLGLCLCWSLCANLILMSPSVWLEEWFLKPNGLKKLAKRPKRPNTVEPCQVPWVKTMSRNTVCEKRRSGCSSIHHGLAMVPATDHGGFTVSPGWLPLPWYPLSLALLIFPSRLSCSCVMFAILNFKFAHKALYLAARRDRFYYYHPHILLNSIRDHHWRDWRRIKGKQGLDHESRDLWA